MQLSSRNCLEIPRAQKVTDVGADNSKHNLPVINMLALQLIKLGLVAKVIISFFLQNSSVFVLGYNFRILLDK